MNTAAWPSAAGPSLGSNSLRSKTPFVTTAWQAGPRTGPLNTARRVQRVHRLSLRVGVPVLRSWLKCVSPRLETQFLAVRSETLSSLATCALRRPGRCRAHRRRPGSLQCPWARGSPPISRGNPPDGRSQIPLLPRTPRRCGGRGPLAPFPPFSRSRNQARSPCQ